jgi:Helix-turn-helix domain
VSANEFNPREFRRGLRDVKLTSTAYRVAVELSEYANPGQPHVWPSVDTLADNCGMRRATIIRALNTLASNGVITATEGRSKGGRNQTTRWHLNCRTAATVLDSETVANPSKTVANPSINRRIRVAKPSHQCDTKEIEEEKEGGGKENAARTPRALAARSGAPTPTPSLLQKNNPQPPICRKHPDGNSDDPCRQCAVVREWQETHQRDAERQQREVERIRGIPDCRQCDSDGYMPDDHTNTPLVLLPPPADQIPPWAHHWLDEFEDPDAGLSWFQLKCGHGTGEEGDDRRGARSLFMSFTGLGGYRACSLQVYRAANGDPEMAYKLDREAFEERQRQREAEWEERDRKYRAEREARQAAEAKAAPAKPPSVAHKPHDMTGDKYESLRYYGDQDDNEGLYTPPSQYCDDHPNGTDKPCWACGEARKNYKAELADWKEWRLDVFKERGRIRSCELREGLCDEQGWWLVDGDHVHMFKDTPKGPIHLSVTCRHDEKKNQAYVQDRLNEGWYFAPQESVADLIAAEHERINQAIEKAVEKQFGLSAQAVPEW